MAGTACRMGSMGLPVLSKPLRLFSTRSHRAKPARAKASCRKGLLRKSSQATARPVRDMAVMRMRKASPREEKGGDSWATTSFYQFLKENMEKT